MAEIDPEIIKKTQDTLGKYFKKPPLTEKLLGRPPFRFLHDIITAVISSTGFMKGLFTDQEMNSENVKDKEAKLIFLDKFISMVSLVVNKSVDVKASSIVAGKEAEKTNVLLQYLAKAINKKVDNAVYVKKVFDGEAKKLNAKPSSSTKEKSTDLPTEKAKPTDKTNEDPKSGDKSKPRKSTSHKEESGASSETTKATHHSSKTKKPKENTEKEEKPVKKPPQEKIEPETVKERDANKERESKKSSRPHRSRTDKNETVPVTNEPNVIETKPATKEQRVEHTNEENANDENDTESLRRMQRPSSAKGTRQRHENDNQSTGDVKEMEIKKPMARPPSARPAPPKLRKSSEANIEENVCIQISQSKVSGLIVDMDRDSDEGDFIVEEFVGGGDIDMKFSHTNQDHNIEEDGIHGSLVTKMIQSKKDFTTSDEKNEVISHSDMNRKRERLANEKEMEKIRQNLQSLTKSVNPLGKLIDFIQEDLDTMQKEADRWRDENEELDKKLLAEQNITNKIIKPIKEKLIEETKTIAAQEEAIAKLKAKIENNAKKIETMLYNVCAASA